MTTHSSIIAWWARVHRLASVGQNLAAKPPPPLYAGTYSECLGTQSLTSRAGSIWEDRGHKVYCNVLR